MATVASYTPAMKQVYKPENLEISRYDSRPGIGLLPKDESFAGENMPIPIQHAGNQMRSHAFTTAQATSKNSTWKRFLLTPHENWALAHVTSQVVARTVNNKLAFLRVLRVEFDSAYDDLADSLETEFYRDENGVLGVVATSGITTTTLTLDDAHTITNFELGMELVFASTATGSIRSGSATITGIDRSAGTLTSDSNWATQVSGATDADSLFGEGDAPNGGDAVGMAGLASWLLASAPSGGESHFSVDRSTDSRLWGTYHDGAEDLIENALIDGQSKAAQLHSGRIECYVLNNVQYRRLVKQLGAKVEYDQTAAMGGKGKIALVAYQGVKIIGDHGPISVIAANKCQSNIAWGLQKDKWKLCSVGPLMRVDDTDGNEYLRRGSAPGVEQRQVSWSNLACKSPGRNVRVALQAA